MIAFLADGVSERAQTGDQTRFLQPIHLTASPLLCKRELAFKTARYADYEINSTFELFCNDVSLIYQKWLGKR